MMELRENVARAITRADYEDSYNSLSESGLNEIWPLRAHLADAAISVLPQTSPDDDAKWVVEQAVRLMAGQRPLWNNGKPATLAWCVDTIRNELARLRQDAEGTR